MNDVFFAMLAQVDSSYLSSYAIYGWLMLSLLFLFVELSNPGFFFFLAFALGCLPAAGTLYFDFSFYVQAAAFLFFSVVSFFMLRRYFARAAKSHVRTNSDALIGLTGIVIHGIESHTPGRVKIRGEEWPAQPLDGTSIAQGSVVEVCSIRGNRVMVRLSHKK
jgi:membrane protein implicated in regulation of membrane protease activity